MTAESRLPGDSRKWVEMNDHQVATATRQNSAYRHRNYEGRFRKRRRPSPFLSHRRRELGFFAEKRQNFFHKRVGCDAVFLTQDWDGAVFDELIGPTDPHDRCIDHLRVQMFHHRAAETVVQNVIFDCTDHVHASGEKFESAGVHRFDPAWINERNGNSFFFELPRGFFGNLEHGTEAEDGNVAPMLDDLRLANLEEPRFRFDFCACPRAAW